MIFWNVDFWGWVSRKFQKKQPAAFSPASLLAGDPFHDRSASWLDPDALGFWTAPPPCQWRVRTDPWALFDPHESSFLLAPEIYSRSFPNCTLFLKHFMGVLCWVKISHLAILLFTWGVYPHPLHDLGPVALYQGGAHGWSTPNFPTIFPIIFSRIFSTPFWGSHVHGRSNFTLMDGVRTYGQFWVCFFLLYKTRKRTPRTPF